MLTVDAALRSRPASSRDGPTAPGSKYWFSQMPSEYLRMLPDVSLEYLGQPVSLDARQVLFSQNEEACVIFKMVEGVLRLSRLLPDGRRHVMGFALAGDFLGLALSSRFIATAEALVPVKAYRFERRALMSSALERPHIIKFLCDLTAHELSIAERQSVLLSRCHALEKVAAFLIGLRQRYERIGHISEKLELPMGRQDMADHLGLTIETVSRMLTRLDREKVILIVPGGVRVLDAARLERLVAN